jgi:hypothetical protein
LTERKINMTYNETFTLTFGDQAENHVGMQKIGLLASEGFSIDDLKNAKKVFEDKGIVCELIDLSLLLDSTEYRSNDNAYVLIARKGLDILVHPETSNDFFIEQSKLDKDTKALMKGRVVNKKARYNLCFSDISQEPEYEKGKGRIVAFDSVPLLKRVRTSLPEILGSKAKDLQCEGNYYYDTDKCYIGYHGDSERRKVIGIRVGKEFPLYYQWYIQSSPVGKNLLLMLGHGDIYIMSEKSTGYDWKKRKILTLRHAAGSTKNVPIPVAPISMSTTTTNSSILTMTYRELQTECKRRGLRAVGKTEELRSRLMSN